MQSFTNFRFQSAKLFEQLKFVSGVIRFRLCGIRGKFFAQGAVPAERSLRIRFKESDCLLRFPEIMSELFVGGGGLGENFFAPVFGIDRALLNFVFPPAFLFLDCLQRSRPAGHVATADFAFPLLVARLRSFTAALEIRFGIYERFNRLIGLRGDRCVEGFFLRGRARSKLGIQLLFARRELVDCFPKIIEELQRFDNAPDITHNRSSPSLGLSPVFQ